MANPVFEVPNSLVTTVTSTLKHLVKLVVSYSVHSFRQISTNMSNWRILNSKFNLGTIKSIVNTGQENEEGRVVVVVVVVVVMAIYRCSLPSYRRVLNWRQSLAKHHQCSKLTSCTWPSETGIQVSLYFTLLAVLSSGSNSLRTASFESKHYWFIVTFRRPLWGSCFKHFLLEASKYLCSGQTCINETSSSNSVCYSKVIP